MPASVSSQKKRVRPITIALPSATIRVLDQSMKQKNISRSRLVDEAIRAFFKARTKEEMATAYLAERQEADVFAQEALRIHAFDE